MLEVHRIPVVLFSKSRSKNRYSPRCKIHDVAGRGEHTAIVVCGQDVIFVAQGIGRIIKVSSPCAHARKHCCMVAEHYRCVTGQILENMESITRRSVVRPVQRHGGVVSGKNRCGWSASAHATGNSDGLLFINVYFDDRPHLNPLLPERTSTSILTDLRKPIRPSQLRVFKEAAANISPSPGGEGRGEDGQTILMFLHCCRGLCIAR